MLSQNKTEGCICPTELQSSPQNTVVIENMVDIKQNESSNNLDATLKHGDKIDKLRSKLKIMTNTIFKGQKRKKVEQRLNYIVTNKVKTRTKGRNRRYVIANAGTTGHFMMQGAQHEINDHTNQDYTARRANHYC